MHLSSLLLLSISLATTASAGVPSKRQIGFGFDRANILRLLQGGPSTLPPPPPPNNLTPAPNPNTSCPPLQIFGARETTAPPGFGTAGTTINLILASNPGAAATAIEYPACGGQAFCGGIDYASSAKAGTLAVAKAVNDFNAACPASMIVLVGYSQGGQVSDNAFCGGGDANIGLAEGEVGSEINEAARERVVAAIFMGSPRFTANVGVGANVGSCTAQGFAPRPAGFVCPGLDKVQSYCDAADPFCCDGDDQAVHQGYGEEFGEAALSFVNGKIAAASAGQ
ncbi:cutinase-domain-containing protein [Ascobolus immersus RN42]|uniref:Cutinase-domain-containing protein n=1 Tax=Ascobolus immersus RN42 TaxID=1160509 RepID=A0A3N4HF93_ASCIM|nr:cutinase-domain-containing protein [Ascobolus immersus RN42]